MKEMYPDEVKDLPHNPPPPRLEVIPWKIIVLLIVTMLETRLRKYPKLAYYYT